MTTKSQTVLLQKLFVVADEHLLNQVVWCQPFTVFALEPGSAPAAVEDVTIVMMLRYVTGENT